MTTKLEQAARQLLRSLESGMIDINNVTALRETLADQAEQEPVIDTCDRGHKFAKLPDHPRKYGKARCPHCLASGLDAARERMENDKQEPVAWLWCKDGKPQSALLHKPTTFPQDSYWQDKGFSAQPLYAALVRTKDLTDDEMIAAWESVTVGYGVPTFANIRAVIAADREKNRG